MSDEPPPGMFEGDDALSEYDRLVGALPRVSSKRRPEPVAERPVPAPMLAFFAARQISEDTVRAFGVFAMARDGKGVIAFPWLINDEEVNRTYRIGPEWDGEIDMEPALFNADSLQDDTGDVVIATDEIEALAFYECGYRQVIVPPRRRLAEAFRRHAVHLDRFQKFYVATQDPALREEIARRLGKHRVWLAEWPNDAPNATATLADFGRNALIDAMKAAEPYPLDGVMTVRAGLLDELVGKPPIPTMTTGCNSTDEILRFPTEGRLIVITGIPGHGKALALDTPVPTPNGWTTMGDIKEGDFVYAIDGSAVRVAHAWPIMTDRPCVSVKFSDGEEIVCDEDHLWWTRCEQARRSEQQTKFKRGDRLQTLPKGTDQRSKKVFASAKTARDIAATLVDPQNGRANHSVPVAGPIVGSGWPATTPPYTMGAWLGDGTSASSAITSADLGVIDRVREDGFTVDKTAATFRWTIRGLSKKLRADGILNNKHIPSDCLRADVSQRWSLLQGLMDTDGYSSRDGTAEFCSTSKPLADATFELCAGLGLKPRLYEGDATLNGRIISRKYRVVIASNPRAFHLARKRESVPASQSRITRSRWRKIVDVRNVPSVPVRCIAVDHPDHLFLVGKTMVPTHNSTVFSFWAVHLMKVHSRRFAIYSPEMSPWPEYVGHLSQILIGKPLRPGRHGKSPMTADERRSAEDFFRDRLVLLEHDSEEGPPPLDWILDKVRVEIIRRGITDFAIDPWTEIDIGDEGKVGGVKLLRDGLQRITAFCKRHNVNAWIIAHPTKLTPAKPGAKIEAPGFYDISGGAQWYNKTTLGITVHIKDEITQIYTRKVRFSRLGKRNAVAMVALDQATGRLSSSSLHEPPKNASLDI